MKEPSKVSVGGDKGLLRKLPVLKSTKLGRIGPGFGFGAGCGFGAGIGLLGGVGFGPGIPGFQLGFGLGAGCGIGLGFGYGAGKGIAYYENRKYSNLGKLPSHDAIDELVDEIVSSTKKLMKQASKEIEKWRGNDV